MSYLVLARKYRPALFEEVVGQEAVGRTLGNAIETGRIGHAYLFAGPRGVGKTSMARILSKALNCEKGTSPHPCGVCANCTAIAQGSDMDVLEIDGASNRGIEEVRAIRENAVYHPTRSRFRIYIVDEVHMLTTQAFNALLKTLEEPPAHVKFIFATTQPQSLPETIRSRCQRFDFRPIAPEAIAKRLEEVCKAEGVKVERAALDAVAQRARGGMRDAQSLLDQVLALGKDKVRVDDVRAILGWVSVDDLEACTATLLAGDGPGVLTRIASLLEAGQDPGEFLLQLGEFLRDLMVVKACGGRAPVPLASGADGKALAALADRVTPENLLYMLQVVQETRRRLSRDLEGRILLEMALLRLAALESLEPVDRALERLARAGPAPSAPAAARTPRAEDDGVPCVEPPPRRETGGPEETLWERLVERMRSEKPQLAAYVREGRPVETGADRWTVGFPEDRTFHKERAQDEANRAVIEAMLQELVGRPLTLSFVTLNETGGIVIAGIREERDAAPAPRPRESKERTDPPIVQKARSLFRGRVVED